MQDLINISDDKYVIWCISVAWNNLRGTSYSLDSINYYNSNNSTQTDKYSFIKYLSYYTFIPTLLTGPIILYDTFEKGFLMNDDAKIIKYKNLSKQIVRYMFWLSLSEFMLHFLYTNVLDRFPNVSFSNFINKLGADTEYCCSGCKCCLLGKCMDMDTY